MRKRKPVLLNGEALMVDGKVLEFDAVDQEELDGKIDAPQTAAVGEALTVEEVGEDGKPKKWKTQTVETAPPDWDENDSTKPGYVKNRTHYIVRNIEKLGNTAADYYKSLILNDAGEMSEIIGRVVINDELYENIKPDYSSSTIGYTIGAYELTVDRRYGGISIIPNADYYFEKVNEELHKIDSIFLPNGYLLNGEAPGSMRLITSTPDDNEYMLGRYSLDFGLRNHVAENYSVAFGMDNSTTGSNTAIFGARNTITGNNSAVFGTGNTVVDNSFSAGAGNTITETLGFAIGALNTASGRSSCVFGENNLAEKDYSAAFGYMTSARALFQTVIGRRNADSFDSLFIIGNGVTSANGKKSNAMTVKMNGDAWFAGDVYVGSTSGTNKDEGSKRLVDTSDLLSFAEMVKDVTIPKPATAQVGQIVKVKAVDADGKITETEAVDIPMQKTLKWITVHSSDLTETKRELIISTDTDGKSIVDYNPVGLSLIVSTPADATVESNNGSPWVYPSATKADNAIRVIGNISGWKTVARDSAFVFNGGSSAMSCSGNVNTSLATYKLDGYALDGVRIFFNSVNDHLPVGTHVEVAILCEVAE